MGGSAYRIASSNSGLVTGSDYRYFKMIQQELKKIHPGAELVEPRFEPVIGAGLIAMDEVGIEWIPEVIRNVEEGCRSEK